ncbi:Hpt domain-containing protein [Paracoccaceae bacterium Fryx2]|nr:Hpt domain-containing protein [Paracoccaceae bacterium Fryx2]
MIDWKRVSDLKAEIGEADFAEVVVVFLEEADEVIARIGSGQGRPSLAGDLHFLKGSALNLGFSALAALCQEGERRAAAGKAGSVDVARVVQAYHDSRRSLDAGLGS